MSNRLLPPDNFSYEADTTGLDNIAPAPRCMSVATARAIRAATIDDILLRMGAIRLQELLTSVCRRLYGEGRMDVEALRTCTDPRTDLRIVLDTMLRYTDPWDTALYRRGRISLRTLVAKTFPDLPTHE